MRRVRASSGRRAAAAVVDVTAAEDTAAAGVTVASEEAAVTSQSHQSRGHPERSAAESRTPRNTLQSFATGFLDFARNDRAEGKYGQDWIRTSEGVKPADLQSAPFGHFGTYPLARGISYILALHSLQLTLAFAPV